MKRWIQIKTAFLFSAVAMGVIFSGQAAGEEDRGGGRKLLPSFRSPPSDSGLSASPRTDLSEDEFFTQKGRRAYSKKKRSRPKRGNSRAAEREEGRPVLERIISVESAGNEEELVFPRTALEGWRKGLVTPSEEEEGTERRRQPSFYYHSSLSNLVSSAEESEAELWEGPIVWRPSSKSYQVLLCAHFEGEGAQEEEESGRSSPVAVGQDVTVLQRYAEDLFPVLGELFQGLRISALDLSYCHMQSAHLNDLFPSLHYLNFLDLSHNRLTTLPVAFAQWLHGRGKKSLREVNLGHNPWDVEALKNIRVALKHSPVHTLRLQAVGLRGGWNELQGFLMGEAYPGLHFLDIRQNNMGLTVSALLTPVLGRETFLLLSDSLHLEVMQKNPRRSSPGFVIADEEGSFYDTPFFHVTHTKGTVDTVQMSASLLSDEDHLLRKLRPRGVRHLELDGSVYHPTKIMSICAWENLSTLNVGRLDLTLPLALQMGQAMKAHRHLFKLDLSEQEDLGWGIISELAKGLRPTDQVLSNKSKRMVKQYQKQLAEWERQPSLNNQQRRQMEKVRGKIAQLTETRAFTLVLPAHLRGNEGALELLKRQSPALLNVEFSEDYSKEEK